MPVPLVQHAWGRYWVATITFYTEEEVIQHCLSFLSHETGILSLFRVNSWVGLVLHKYLRLALLKEVYLSIYQFPSKKSYMDVFTASIVISYIFYTSHPFGTMQPVIRMLMMFLTYAIAIPTSLRGMQDGEPATVQFTPFKFVGCRQSQNPYSSMYVRS